MSLEDTSEAKAVAEELVADPIDAMYPDDVAEVVETPEVEDEAEEIGAEIPAIEMPNSWSKDDRAIWEALSPEQQAVVGRREAERDAKLKDLSNDTARIKWSASAEAHKALAENYDHSAQVLQTVVSRFMPEKPNPALLSGTDADRLEHYAQTERYKAALDEIQQIVGERDKLQEQAKQAEMASLREAAKISWQNIVSENPDWFDPSANDLTPDARSLIETTGAELGYPINLKEEFCDNAIGLAEIDESFIFAIKRANEWRVKSEKWDSYEKSKAEGQRVVKKLPKTVAQTTVSTPKGPDDWLKAMYPND